MPRGSGRLCNSTAMCIAGTLSHGASVAGGSVAKLRQCTSAGPALPLRDHNSICTPSLVLWATVVCAASLSARVSYWACRHGASASEVHACLHGTG